MRLPPRDKGGMTHSLLVRLGCGKREKTCEGSMTQQETREGSVVWHENTQGLSVVWQENTQGLSVVWQERTRNG